MLIQKGDIVRTSSGETGEVKETWGLARNFVRLILEDGTTKPFFEAEIIEIVMRPKSPRGRR